MSPSFFIADNLSAGYGKKTVLENISFSLEEGTITGLLGANGSGKSTLLKALCHLVPIKRCHAPRDSLLTKSTCLLKGTDIHTLSPRKLAGMISYIPQRSGITLSLPLADVVMMGFNPGLKLLEQPSPSQQKEALQALAAVGLAGREMDDYLTLSEGQKQLCILARTMVENTSLLLLDEPDSALDFHNRYQMMQILQRIVADHEKAALICLHDPGLALDFCDQLLLLKEGRCIASLHPASDSLTQMQEAFCEIYGPVSLVRCTDRYKKPRLVLLSDL